jgi:putative flippase GtrA
LLRKLLNKEVLNYIIWGIVTSVWNIGIFQLLFLYGLDYRISNAIALISTKIFAYVVNKLFVFKSHCKSFAELFFQIFRFILTRGFTMLVDFFGLILLNYIMEPRIGKLITTLVVVVLNYIFGKFHVFTEKQI